ncbi:TauD/TfdA family dioxygenase [Halioxenophilus sp. WMMB6]|uniref:TauD/TfdA dioxygenase family protein n=1 Tax=Halioxenophilus sp. WMMB6 TaxID=3073815 RepID=UPI00295EB62C|nr:TauD/TfdA family dioxygenase [Halioxenophilus sp. WMMB6]
MVSTTNTLTLLDSVEVTELQDSLPFGAIVKGLTLAMLDQSNVRQALKDLFIDRGVILFQGENSHEMQLELSRCVGPLERFPYPQTWVEDHPELVKIKYFPDNGTCYEVNGERLGGWVPWHTDLIYTDEINRGGILRPAKLSEHGGITGFLDQILAYDKLPSYLQKEIENLHVVYSPDINLENSKFAGVKKVKFIRGANSFNDIIKNVYDRPLVMHPMVFTQAETGRKILNVSPGFAHGIYEIGGPEGDALLSEVAAYCTNEDFAYFHHWQEGDMVLWDNWRVLHCATGVPVNEERMMYRTTIAGDYRLGKKLEWGKKPLEKIDI